MLVGKVVRVAARVVVGAAAAAVVFAGSGRISSPEPGLRPTGGLRTVFKKPMADSPRDLKQIFDFRHQLEFVPSGRNVYGKPTDQFGYVIQKTARPAYHPLEDWQVMEIGRRRKAATIYPEEKQVLAARGGRPANLQAILEGYSACGGYLGLLDYFPLPAASHPAPWSSGRMRPVAPR